MPHDRPASRTRPGGRPRPRPLHVEQVEARQLMATFSVTVTGDAGAGSLRQAILDSNASPGQDTISFAIPGAGPHSIAPLTDLPTISDPTVLDATTQPGYAGTPVIEINGSLDASPTIRTGLTVAAPNTTVRGLAINRFNGYGIDIQNAIGGTIAGNAIGTDPSGTLALGNRTGGIRTLESRALAIGGPAARDGNTISGNAGDGIFVANSSGQPTGIAILGNRIGTDPAGTLVLPNSGNGVLVEASGVQVGGVAPGQANIIANNGFNGVQIGSFSFQSNRTSNPIRGNSIFANDALGIDLGGNGVTSPDSFGTGFGPNRLQAFPSVNAAFPSAGGAGTTVEGRLVSTPNATFTIDFYGNDTAGRSGYGQGRRYLGSAQATANADGNADFAPTLPVAVPPGQLITATATDGDGNTSEFSLARSVTPTAQANLSVSIFDFPDPVLVRGDLAYTVTVVNNGPTRATGVTLTDALPAGATFLSATTSQGTFAVADGVLTAGLGELRTGEFATVRITVRPTAEGTITTTATVRADQADPEAGNNTATATTTVNPPTPADLVVYSFAATAPLNVGEDQLYTVVVGNNGPNPVAGGVTLIDTLPEGAAFVSASVSQGTFSVADGILTANLGDLQRGGNAVVQITVRPTIPGRFTNKAVVVGAQADQNALNNTSTLEQLVSVAFADLSVSAVALPNPPQQGRPLTYTFNVRNPGPGDSTATTLIDELDPGVTFVSATSSQGTATASGGIVTANLGTIIAGQSAQVTIVVIPSVIGVISNTATIRADQPDFNPADNVVTTTSTVVSEVTPPTILAQRLIATRTAVTGVVLTFSEAMNPDQVEALNNYQVRPSNADGVARGAPVAIASARYDARRRTVTLTFARPLPLGRFYALTANGVGASGLVDPSGNVLDGDLNGLPDGIFQATIGRGTISRPRRFQLDQVIPIPARKVKKAPAPATPATPKVLSRDVALDLSFTRRLIQSS
ncbi:hypothetical protein TA3x_000049 [Tundrisphaera sp. TA3]|uniref:hypothetical protein n=1 Tax=Tundrisphaera sp. TA3 TaxID=3435775 RepID=UPI003EC1283F